ncbi:hypothetical protein B0H13DRAFT_2344347 [Mycena leptocephala]|nr:hypothetical protein B0H13DRAFT_2344347 [Mycena leptocephala]
MSFTPSSSFHDLWPRYWAWFKYFRSSVEHCEDSEDAELQLCQSCVGFVASLSRTPETSRLVSGTAGVRNVIARTWWLLVRKEVSHEHDMSLDTIIGCMVGVGNASQTSGLAEYIQGAGGDIDDLASLVARTISQLVPSRSAPAVSAQTLKLLRGLLQFIVATDNVHDGQRNSQILSTALRNHRVARILTTVIDALAASALPGSSNALHDSFTLLSLTFSARQGYVWIAEALKSGLLRAMVKCENQGPSSAVHGHLKLLLQAVLPPALVHYSVVRPMQGALSDIQDIVPGSSLPRTEMWQQFVGLARERMTILTAVDLPAVWQAACDNIECGVISSKPSFKRCSGCKNAYYCSRECQISDWRHGGHRTICSLGLNLSLTEFNDVSRCERAFMRAVVQKDYEAGRVENIYPSQALCMAMYPSQAFFTIFDYTRGRAKIDVVNAAQAVQFQNLLGPEWTTALSRASRSEGRMELHIVHLIEGVQSRYWLVPLRINTSSLYAGIKRISNTLPPGVDEARWRQIYMSVIRDVRILVNEQERTGLHAIH